MKTQNQKNQNRKIKIFALALQIALGLLLTVGQSMKVHALNNPFPGITDGLSNTVHFPERPELLEENERKIPCSVLRDRGRFQPNFPAAPGFNADLPQLDCEEDETIPSPSPSPEAVEQPAAPAPQAREDNRDAAEISLPANPSALAGGGCTLATGAESGGLLSSLLLTVPLLLVRKPKKKN